MDFSTKHFRWQKIIDFVIFLCYNVLYNQEFIKHYEKLRNFSEEVYDTG